MAATVSVSKARDQSPFDDVEATLRKTEALGVALVAAGLIAAGVYGHMAGGVLKFLGASVAIVLALGGLGAFLGFLFAIPRTGAPKAAEEAAGGKPAAEGASQAAHAIQSGRSSAAVLGMSTNSNLVDVSDWLTKIIVGIGLTQFNEIDDALGRLASAMEKMFPGTPGVGVYFNCLAVAAVFYGFLFFYVQTRTRGVMMFAHMEALQRDVSTLSVSDAMKEQFAVSPFEASAHRVDGETPTAAPAPKDREILAAGPEKLSTADQFAAFAGALVRNQDFSAGASAWIDAIKRDTEKARPEFRKRLAEVLFNQKRPKEALAALKDAIAAEQDPKAKLDLKRNALFNALYLDQQNGFVEAKPLSDELLASETYGKDPWVLLWTIAALGQQAAWVSKQPGADLQPIKDEVLKRIDELKAVTEPASEQRAFLRRILDPSVEGGSPSEDDLVTFKDDADVRAAVEG